MVELRPGLTLLTPISYSIHWEASAPVLFIDTALLLQSEPSARHQTWGWHFYKPIVFPSQTSHCFPFYNVWLKLICVSDKRGFENSFLQNCQKYFRIFRSLSGTFEIWKAFLGLSETLKNALIFWNNTKTFINSLLCTLQKLLRNSFGSPWMSLEIPGSLSELIWSVWLQLWRKCLCLDLLRIIEWGHFDTGVVYM